MLVGLHLSPGTRLFFWVGLLVMVILGNGCAGPPKRFSQLTSDKIISLARSLRGVPYRFAGNTPQGFDCSGFVQYVFKQAVGIKLSRTSKGQFAETFSVPLGQEQPADLVFYDIKGKGPSHVGIYLGRGLFIHAPSSGGAVKISDANDTYWRRHIIGVHRVWQ